MRHLLTSALFLGVAALAGGAASADEKKQAVPPDEKAMLEAMLKAATPGEQHKKLEPLAGTWELSVQSWMDPSKPPSASKATSEIKWIMGNRFLEETVKGEFAGMEFNGRNLIGYDNLRKKYTTVWISTMCTSIANGTGEMSADGKTLTTQTEGVDPISGQTIKGKDVLQIVSNDNLEATFYKTLGGQEVKVMHITYVRKK
jgi:Protein of unknown function (DUF1579)